VKIIGILASIFLLTIIFAGCKSEEEKKDEPVKNAQEVSSPGRGDTESFRRDLDLKTRQEIYYESIAAENRASAESKELKGDDLTKKFTKLSELRKKYHKAVAEKYGISVDQVGEIVIEGEIKGWSRPKQ
jgi:hypothetical protein